MSEKKEGRAENVRGWRWRDLRGGGAGRGGVGGQGGDGGGQTKHTIRAEEINKKSHFHKKC